MFKWKVHYTLLKNGYLLQRYSVIKAWSCAGAKEKWDIKRAKEKINGYFNYVERS